MSTRPRCFVYLLNQYFKRLPPKALELDVFYIRPKTKYEEEGPWYDCVPVGKGKLRKYMEFFVNVDITMCQCRHNNLVYKEYTVSASAISLVQLWVLHMYTSRNLLSYDCPGYNACWYLQHKFFPSGQY